MDNYEERDRVLRACFEGRNWDNSGEYSLKRKLVLSGDPLLAEYPFLYDDEWEVQPGQSNLGKGDLVFTDGEGRFAVIEVKYLNPYTGKTARVKRNKQRNQVVEQAKRYAEEFQRLHPEATSVVAMTYTDEGGLKVVEDSPEEDFRDDEDFWKAPKF